MNNEAKDILKWQGMLNEMEDVELVAGAAEPEPRGKVPERDEVLKWLKDNENPSDYRVKMAAEEKGWDYVSLEEVIFSIASEYARKK